LWIQLQSIGVLSSRNTTILGEQLKQPKKAHF
jgi:hypothetical protein